MVMKNIKINIKGHIVEVVHKNGEQITFSVDLPDSEIRPYLKHFPMKDRLKYFDTHGTMKGY